VIIGVVTEAKDKNILQRIFKFLNVKIIETEENPFKLVMVSIPYSKQKLEKVSLRRISQLLKKSVKKARKSGAEKVIWSQPIMRLMCEKGLEMPEAFLSDGKLFFLRLAPACIRQTAAETGEKLIYQSVCISDSKMDRISEYLLRELCYDTKRMTVVTQNRDRAERFCEAFFEESGLWVEVRSDLPKQAGILIDVDGGFIRFGNALYIRDIDFGYKLFECDVKSIDIAACFREAAVLKFKGIYSYDKKG